MRPESIVLLVATALLACVDVTSVATSSKSTTVAFPGMTHSFADNQDIISTKRFLRTSVAANEDDEERAGFDAITGLIKAGTLKSWLLRNKDGVQVLNKLKLGDNVGAALKNTNLNTLSKYITMFNEKHPNSKISLIGTLTSHYGDDVVAKALVSAQTHANTEALASQLRTEQLAAWLKNDNSVVDVFKLLKLSDDGYLALTSRKLEVLEDYISLFNRKKSAQKTLLTTLTAGFGGERRLAELLVAAKANPFTRGKAKELESALFDKWLASKLQPQTVLKNLRLDDNVMNALGDFNLQTLTNYISVFNKKNPGSELSLLGTLTAHYGDDIVAKALVSARTDPTTEWMATSLQSQQLEGCLNSGKSVDDVYALLKLKDNGMAAIVSRKLETLDGYIKLFNREKSADESVIKAMAAGFGGEDKLATALENARRYPLMNAKATKLQKAQFTQWLDEGYDSISVLNQVFKVEEAKLAGASRSQKSIANQFKAFYERDGGVQRCEPEALLGGGLHCWRGRVQLPHPTVRVLVSS